MKNKKLRILSIAIAGLLGIIIAIILRGVEDTIRKTITDYLFASLNIIIGLTLIGLAFSDKFRNDKKINPKMLILGGAVVFSCGVLMFLIM